MPKSIRTPEIAAENWKNRASNAADFWVKQVEAAAWKTYAASPAAEANYAKAMTEVINKKSRLEGVNASNDEVWKSGVRATGSSGFSTAVSRASPKMHAVMSKLIPAIDNVRKGLGPRGVRGSPENIKRATDMMTGLSKFRGQFKARGVAKSAT
jgi:hypothetical protein